MNTMNGLATIIAKLKDLKGLKTDREVGELLGYKGSGLHEAERTNRIPLKRLLQLSAEYDFSLEWLLFNRGPVLRQTLPEPHHKGVSLDEVILTEIISAIEEFRMEQNIAALKPATMAGVIKDCYDRYALKGEEIKKDDLLIFFRTAIKMLNY
jgi:hypothetical protein